MEAVNALVREMEKRMNADLPDPDHDFAKPYKVGVDLGTSNIVIIVLDRKSRPVAGAIQSAHVVRDGIVVDYVEAVELLGKMKNQLESRLGERLTHAATAIPPGITSGNVKVITNVVEAAGFAVTHVIDEPEAAALALGIANGAVVDMGGGTTGISVIRNGMVEFSVDEPTGGVHVTLVISGSYGVSFEEAETYKHDPERSRKLLPVIQPVMEKMAEITKRSLPADVDTIYLAGGTSCFEGIEEIFRKYTSVPAIKPENPLLITPIGIAMSDKGGEQDGY